MSSSKPTGATTAPTPTSKPAGNGEQQAEKPNGENGQKEGKAQAAPAIGTDGKPATTAAKAPAGKPAKANGQKPAAKAKANGEKAPLPKVELVTRTFEVNRATKNTLRYGEVKDGESPAMLTSLFIDKNLTARLAEKDPEKLTVTIAVA
jgi:hypothetical protein